jgi:hypothetical protein
VLTVDQSLSSCGITHPPQGKSAWGPSVVAPNACMTPSSVMKVETTSYPMVTVLGSVPV